MWDRGLAPLLRISPGDIVDFELHMAGKGQVSEGAAAEEVTWDFETIYNLTGPVWIEGAQPGDTLEVKVLSLQPGDWGWTAVIPGLGLLPDDFPGPILRTFDLRGGRSVQVADGTKVPQRPFLGVMGVATDEPQAQSPCPPHKGGGNLDNRHIGVGASVYLPIWCEGGLFSCGDGHATQGDGEVCVTALECDMRASLEFSLHRGRIPGPALYAPSVRDPLADGAHYGTMGLSGDLFEASQIAVRNMVEWLASEKGLSREDAYILCSLAGDLRIHEIVDAGTWNVGFMLPLAVFAE
jgi:acetamidase/formamidase